MHLVQGNIYHVFNRGNNKQRIFFRQENYDYFIKKIKRHLVPICDILAWCLMPNHFHLLVHANEKSALPILDGRFPQQRFSHAMQKLLSGYALGINTENNRSGSLFQQNTKAVFASSHIETVFHYIHQNPLKAGLVTKMEDWPHSSFREYADFPNYALCNQALAHDLLQIHFDDFYAESYKRVSDLDVPHYLAL